jgi:hypothetical protein
VSARKKNVARKNVTSFFRATFFTRAVERSRAGAQLHSELCVILMTLLE